MSARRILIEMALRRQRPGAGSLLGDLENRIEVREWWRSTVEALAGIPHLVVGGVACNSYMAARVTHDLDVAVLPRDHPAAEEALRSAGWEHLEGCAWRSPQGAEVDLMAMTHPWAEEAMAHPWLEPRTGLMTVAEPYLVLMKLRVSRTTDLADLSRMLGAASDEALAGIRSAVERYGGPDDLRDLESLLTLGRLERGSEARGQYYSRTLGPVFWPRRCPSGRRTKPRRARRTHEGVGAAVESHRQAGTRTPGARDRAGDGPRWRQR
jgi:hypothetical protein